MKFSKYTITINQVCYRKVGNINMAINFTVIVKTDELEKALKKMKTKSIKSGLVLEMRQRRYFEKGSDKRIRKAKEMLINTKKKKRLRERDL